MVYNREQAAQRAEASKTNTPDACQAWTRSMLGAPSAGDYDHDGAADAEDGWKSEPTKYRHTDRHPPRGVPVSYLGGSHDNGHRAVSLGNGMIRSTDAGGRGKVATVPLDWPERTWGLKYVGWSESIDGVLIPEAPAPKVEAGGGRPKRVQKAIDKAKAEKASIHGKPTEKKRLKKGLGWLRKIGGKK
jgi:hypothetical protein